METLKKIQKYCLQKRMRVNEYFKDFDNLKSGYVTKNQFRRCLSMLRIDLKDDEFNKLVEGYIDEKSGRVNHQKFSYDVNIVFGKVGMEKDPFSEIVNVKPLLERKVNEFDSEEKNENFKKLLVKLKFECDKNGLSVRGSFKDFDKLNIGIVTLSQFLRGLPFKKIKKDDIALLTERYEEKGGVNYMKFQNEVSKV